MKTNNFYNTLTDIQMGMLKTYLYDRYEHKKRNAKFGVVYDILHQCDLKCKGCGTNAIYSTAKQVEGKNPSLEQIKITFDKIKKYSEVTKLPVFINIGGGEPFLRNDIIEVLKIASDFFGSNGVGVDTNGTLDNSFELISEAINYVSYVGISINGLEKYHNWWAGNSKINAFERSMSVVSNLCKEAENQKIIEVTSVATKNNISDIPILMDNLNAVGVKNYSIHRAIPVGRMAKHLDLIPNATEYLSLLISILERSKVNRLSVHLHHSIESIHQSVLLGLRTYFENAPGNPDAGSSLGIEPDGALVFDPWCTSGVWKNLSSGNIYEENTDFYSLLNQTNGTTFDIVKMYSSNDMRCQGCDKECSGGSRIVSAATNLGSLKQNEITTSHILNAMTAIDPACPFFKN